MNWEKLENFVDDTGTIFTKLNEESEYDYQLEDKDGIDECTYMQMKLWNVQLEK